MACSAAAESGNQAEKIIGYTENKIDLINLKVIIEQIFLKIPKEHSELLMLRYVDNMQNKDIAELKNWGMRTYFRKLSRALTAFENEVETVACEHKDIFDKLLGQKWIEMAFDEHLKKVDSMVCGDSSSLEKLVRCPIF
jgi:hypothetical protein